jgi:ABC-2 type transport system ATP-binding protein
MLNIHKLSFRYPTASVAALSEVSFEAHRGEVLGLLGPNGAGKTTLIGHLSGQLAVQSGDITLDQQALALVRAQQPTRIAVAPQEYAFYPRLSVAENLACFAGVGALTWREQKARITDCIAFAQLERYARVQADRLSGGLKRRLNLAIALLHRPELLLFDEPTVGVDPQSRAFLLQAIQQLAQDGCAVIYTSHYMEEVEAIAERVVILDQGRVLAQGALHDLLNTSGTQLQLAVEGGELERLKAVLTPFGEVSHQGADVQVTLASRHSFAQVIAAVDAAGLVPSQVRFGHANLEQLFMSLTHHSLRD